MLSPGHILATDQAHGAKSGPQAAGLHLLQVNRKSDIYVFGSSFSHNVVPKDKWLAFVSTTVETSKPEAELAPGKPPLLYFKESRSLSRACTNP